MIRYIWEYCLEEICLVLIAGLGIIFCAIVGTTINFFILIWDGPYVVWLYQRAKRQAKKEQLDYTCRKWQKKGMYVLDYLANAMTTNGTLYQDFKSEQVALKSAKKESENESNSTTAR